MDSFSLSRRAFLAATTTSMAFGAVRIENGKEIIDAPPVTPDFTANQVYLGVAPGGIEALWAHTQPGGKGDGIRIIDRHAQTATVSLDQCIQQWPGIRDLRHAQRHAFKALV